MQGILFALIPMVAWGSIGFVSNKIGGKPDQQTLGMTLGALCSTRNVSITLGCRNYRWYALVYGAKRSIPCNAIHGCFSR